MSSVPFSPHELLDDGTEAKPGPALLIVGCGNVLRGDDALGPILIRQLWAEGVPDGVRLVDGGTAGIDIAFQMRGAERVVIVDAASTGSEPGTVYRVPGAELAELPPLSGLHTHLFRWDHALAFARWLLGPQYPLDITVFLVEVAACEPGDELSRPVTTGLATVRRQLELEFLDPLARASAEPDSVQITADGYLRLSAAVAQRYFPADACGAVLDGTQLSLIPLLGQANGGQLLKQRNAAGDRCMLIREVLNDKLPVGSHPARWQPALGALVVSLDQVGT